ncbi:Transcription factor Pcc1 [Candidatus Burarchaeum australiense]|nr:Transcription factor Pcc1 [Candidatus Burarchaeum australiense]
MPKADCTLTIHFGSEKEAQQAGLILERETAFKKRGSAEVRIKNRSLTIVVQADDIVAMRATLNTYLRHLQVVGAVSEVAGNG